MSETRPARERCPKCSGVGVLPDLDLETWRDGPSSVPYEVCTRCMEHGYVPSRTHVFETCSVCGGKGYYVDADTVEGWPHLDPAIECTDCIGTGECIRKITRKEKVLGFIGCAWPPDPESPRNYPTPEQGRYEDRERKRIRRERGIEL